MQCKKRRLRRVHAFSQQHMHPGTVGKRIPCFLPLHPNMYFARDDDVSFFNSTASTWTLATPRTTIKTHVYDKPHPLRFSQGTHPRCCGQRNRRPRCSYVQLFIHDAFIDKLFICDAILFKLFIRRAVVCAIFIHNTFLSKCSCIMLGQPHLS